MKKYIFMLIALVIIPFNVSALTIDSLGLSIDLPNNYKVTTRDDKDSLYDFYKTGTYLKMEDYLGSDMYIRAVSNPGIQDYKAKADLLDEIYGLIKVVNTNEYEYLDSGDYRFIKFEYKSKDGSKELVEYYLSWKDIFVTITFQSTGDSLTNAMKETTDDIIKTIKLTGNGKADGIHVDESKLDIFTDKKVEITKYIIEVLVCGVIIFITYKFARRRK